MQSSRARVLVSVRRAFAATALASIFQLVGLGGAAGAAERTLTVAISPDLPPYVMQHATEGIEVEILQRTLPGYTLRFVALPYAELQTAVPKGRADVTVGVQHFSDDGVFYSRDFVTFVNAAIVKKAAGIEIDSIADLAGHTVIAWEDAYLELGDQFKRLFAPGGPQRQNYVEVGHQKKQVREFWRAPEAVVVIDRAIFNYFSRELGHSTDDVVFHALFPPVTDFKVGFKEAALRDAFDRALVELCRSGGYDEILKRYQVELPQTVCQE